MSGYDDDFARLDNDAARIANDDNGDGIRRPKAVDDEDCSYNSMGDDPQVDESIQELKRISAIP